ncbi:MAG: DUF502 domain-containing protein [Dehalococcoidia bacterium]|nr:DUF502 domain-containing protein [Dehalococcoidia bacterium]
MNSKEGVLNRIKNHFQSKTVDGLVEIAPTLITIIVIGFLVGYVDSFIRPLMFISDKPWDFPGIGVIVGVVVSYIIGLFISSSMGAKCMRGIDFVISHIPFAKTVFGVSRQIMSSMTSQYNFSRVVFIEWPRENMIAMGFVTGRAYSENTGDALAVVYVPTVPNPTSGNMALVLEDHLIETDMSVEDAMKLVFSGGISLPEDFALARVPVNEERATFGSYGGFKVQRARDVPPVETPKT